MSRTYWSFLGSSHAWAAGESESTGETTIEYDENQPELRTNVYPAVNGEEAAILHSFRADFIVRIW
jgi:hypothetical protein